MKLKHLLLSLMTVCFIAFLTVSCGPDNPPQGPGSGNDSIPKNPKDSVNDTIVNPDPGEPREQVYHYGNCNKSVNHGVFYSSENETTIGAATLISSNKILNYGNKIVGVRVYLGENVYNTSVFFGEDLSNPAITKDFERQDGGWNVVLFDEPVDVPATDFYVGCNLTGSGKLIGYEQGTDKGTEFVNLSGWQPIGAVIGSYKWSIQLLVAGGDYSIYMQDDIIVENFNAPRYVTDGVAFGITCEVRNNGVHYAENVEVKCNVAGTSYTYTVPERMIHGQSVVVSFPDVVVSNASGYGEIAIEADMSAKDINVSNNEAGSSVRIYPADAPVRKAVLAEIFTAQGCPHCGPGDEKFYNVLAGMPAEYRDRVAAVAHHLDWFEDSFVIPESNELADVIDFFGIPTLLIDRAPADYEGGYMFDGHPGEIDFDAMKLQIDEPALATIEMTRLYDSSTRNLEVSVNGVCDENEIYVTILLLQDGFVDWQSYNANTVYNFEHHDVVRAFVTKIDGDRITLGADGSYSADYTFAIPQSVTGHACDVDRMSVVAFVHGNVSDEDKREVFNAIKMPVK